MLTKSFHGKPTFFMSCVKKTNFDVKKGFSRDIFFLSFVHSGQKISIFRKTYGAHIERRDVRAKFLFRIFFDIPKCFF